MAKKQLHRKSENNNIKSGASGCIVATGQKRKSTGVTISNVETVPLNPKVSQIVREILRERGFRGY